MRAPATTYRMFRDVMVAQKHLKTTFAAIGFLLY